MHSPLTHVNFLISVKKQDFMAQSSFKEVYIYISTSLTLSGVKKP